MEVLYNLGLLFFHSFSYNFLQKIAHEIFSPFGISFSFGPICLSKVPYATHFYLGRLPEELASCLIALALVLLQIALYGWKPIAGLRVSDLLWTKAQLCEPGAEQLEYISTALGQ